MEGRYFSRRTGVVHNPFGRTCCDVIAGGLGNQRRVTRPMYSCAGRQSEHALFVPCLVRIVGAVKGVESSLSSLCAYPLGLANVHGRNLCPVRVRVSCLEVSAEP